MGRSDVGVSMLYVAAPRRRHGVGGVLLRELVHHCTTPKLFTSTNANLPMQALLARFGFEPSGIIHNLDPCDPELVYVCFCDARRAHMPTEAATALLAAHGFVDVPRADTRPWNFVLGDANGRQLDVHAVTFDEHGDGAYGPADHGEAYPAEALTGEGVIAGRRVRCVSPAWLVRFRSGYEPRAVDRLDVAALCERFGIELPEAFTPMEAPESIRYDRDPPLSNRDLGDLLHPGLAEGDHRDDVAVLERSLLWICAYEGERLVGFCHLAWDGGVHAFLLDPTVREGYRRRGIGTTLVREALAAAAEHAKLEWVHVDASAALMERFYEPAGFRPMPAGVVWIADLRAGRVT